MCKEICKFSSTVTKNLSCGHEITVDCNEKPVEIEKTFPNCQHKVTMICYRNETYMNHVIIEKNLPYCKHKTRFLICREDHNLDKCPIEVEKIFPKCQHKQIMSCYKDPSMVKCRTQVEKVLPKCEHKQIMRCYKDPSLVKCRTDTKCN